MLATSKSNNVLSYKGSSYLKQRLVLSVLSGKAVKIEDIRSYHDTPGLQEFEVNLIRLLDKVTNGTIVELNQTGTSLYFQPGMLTGGNIDHDCSLQRGIGYYLEIFVLIGIFCKTPLKLILRGITNNAVDPSVDYIISSYLPVLKRFILDDEDLNIKILKRGMSPLGGGEIVFNCPLKKQVRPLVLTENGMVKRIRGIAYALRVSPSIANRMVTTAKGVLLNFIPDVYINTDQCKGSRCGKSPGYGIHLVAETTNGVFYSAEQVSKAPGQSEELSVPEDVGTDAAERLLQEIYLGGSVDSASQSLAFLLMALSQKDVSKIMTGPLTDYTVWFLRHLREFFGLTFKLEYFVNEDNEIVESSEKIIATCVGIGYSNINKRVI